VTGGEVRGRYSVVGMKPDLIWRCHGETASINREARFDPQAFTALPGHPLDSMRALIAESRIEMPADLPPIAAQRAEAYFGRVPTGQEVVILGDTPADVTCGASIGARAIAVATGSYSREVLHAAGAHASFDTFVDTNAVLDAIFG